MNTKIQSVRFTADQKLIAFAETKIAKLEKFYDKIISADITMSLDKDNLHGNKVVVIVLNVPGESLVADRQSESFEESIDLCIDALKKQIDKFKNKK
ncbi:MAG: ribosome-associated translation inhibitor RaiA [Bacteroidetes bacterium]|nr:ribosome-associated translation inhibitor RaiA [Bacteroidota bacterium]